MPPFTSARELCGHLTPAACQVIVVASSPMMCTSDPMVRAGLRHPGYTLKIVNLAYCSFLDPNFSMASCIINGIKCYFNKDYMPNPLNLKGVLYRYLIFYKACTIDSKPVPPPPSFPSKFLTYTENLSPGTKHRCL